MSRKQEFQEYYTQEDYEDVMKILPDIIKEAEKKAGEVIEPTIHEKNAVMNTIKDYIRSKKRKVYGGTALNEALKAVNPKDAIYDEYKFSDIEFYSPTPVPDLVELTNLLYMKGFKHVVCREAQHEETYTLFVNFQLYCDITYVPTRVYRGIKTILIDGIEYVHPHFSLIDLLRMFNDPLNAASQRWLKAFDRIYKLLKNYKLEYFDKSINVPFPPESSQRIMKQIKTEFMLIKDVKETCLISGFEAYNFFIKHAAMDRDVEQMARTSIEKKDLMNLVSNVPYMDLVSITYTDTVEKMYTFLKSNVDNPNDIHIEEYFPLFQLTNYSVIFYYKDDPVVRIFEADGSCIPNIKTSRGYMYVSYQYLLMALMINKFREFLNKDREMYFNYGIAISNLVNVRNIYLNKRKLGVINNTVFTEFKISCVGSTVSYMRMSLLRGLEKIKKGKGGKFSYNPENFIDAQGNVKTKFDPTKHHFRNSSGNLIMNSKNLLFRIDSNGNITRTSRDYDEEDEKDEDEKGEEKGDDDKDEKKDEYEDDDEKDEKKGDE